ncbi:MAG: ATP-binding protein [Pseudolabrys sp.]
MWRDRREAVFLFRARLRANVTTKARGMGMGLSICQSIIENHGGRIWVSPGANGGSIFQFELPMAASRDQAALIGVVQSVSAL